MSENPDHDNVDRVERVRVDQQPGYEQREEVVHDVGRERQQIVHRVTQLIWWFGAIILGMLGIRFLLRLVAANPGNPFADFVYGFTDIFMWPFANLTVTPQLGAVVFEINALIAILVYALAFWLVVKLIWLIFAPTRSKSISTYQRDID